MPLPLILIGIGIGSALTGIGSGAKGAYDINYAGKVNRNAEKLISESKKYLNKAKNQSKTSLSNLGEKKLCILDGSIQKFVSTFEKIKNIELTDSLALEELNKFRMDRQSFVQLKTASIEASSVVGGLVSGTLGGALTAFGAYGLASTFAAASTGTAIASLSGAAATNATLAFFGGGSLAAGGLGMAGGTAVLGGLVAGPALAIMGISVAAAGSKALDDAYSNYSIARKNAEELKTAAAMCIGIARRANMYYRLLLKLESVFVPLISDMQKIIEEKGTDFNLYELNQKKTIAAAASWAGVIKAVLDTPILTEDGALTKESRENIIEISEKTNLYNPENDTSLAVPQSENDSFEMSIFSFCKKEGIKDYVATGDLLSGNIKVGDTVKVVYKGEVFDEYVVSRMFYSYDFKKISSTEEISKTPENFISEMSEFGYIQIHLALKDCKMLSNKFKLVK